MPSVEILSITCFALLAIGYGIFVVLARVPATSKIITEAWPILHAETVIVATVATAFWIGGWILQLCVLGLAARVGFEAASVAQARGLKVPPILFAVALPLAGWTATLISFVALGWMVLIATLIAIAILFAFKSKAPVALELFAFPIAPTIVFIAAAFSEPAVVWMLIAFILVETFDSYALLGGKLFGHTRAFPNLSPNKTVEGLCIGGVMLMFTAAIAGKIVADAPIVTAVQTALIVGVLTIVGDLSASRLKRQSGVKDYPTIMSHQGGLLDIADAWLVAGAGLAWLAQVIDLT